MTVLWLTSAALALWLLVLTIVCAGIVRYVSTLRLAQQAGEAPRLSELDLEADGLRLDSPLPADVQAVIERQPAAKRPERLLFFLSPGCGTCVAIGREAAASEPIRGSSLFFVPGAARSTTSALDELLAALRPAGDRVVTTDDARAVMNSLGIHALPFVVATVDGRVTHKKFIRRESELQEFLDRVALERALSN